MYTLLGCLPDGRVSAAVCARRDAVHQLFDDRAAGRDSVGAPRRSRRLAVRLRRVPGSLSVERAGGRTKRAFVAEVGRHGPPAGDGLKSY